MFEKTFEKSKNDIYLVVNVSLFKNVLRSRHLFFSKRQLLYVQRKNKIVY